MKKLLILPTTLLLLSAVQSQTLKSYEDSLSYAVGILWGQNIKQQGLEVNASVVGEAIGDLLAGEGELMDIKTANDLLRNHISKKQEIDKQKNLAEGKAFLEENSKKEGVVTLPSGLQYLVLKEGTGPKPKATDKVLVHYEGRLIDGTIFDSSIQRGEPISFPVTGVIQGWVEALQMMKVGSKWKLFIPENLAYGARGAGGQIGPYATLIFEVELLGIQ